MGKKQQKQHFKTVHIIIVLALLKIYENTH